MASTMGGIEGEIQLRPRSQPADMEATLAALSAVAASAERVLRRPRGAVDRPRTEPRFWDARPIDARPDDCWRCDAASSVDRLGLCRACRAHLCT